MARKMDMVVLGPGLSLNDETQKLIREIAVHVEKPLLIDGDGITAISEVPDLLRKRKGKTVLTPHLGEMSRLTGLEKNYIDENRISPPANIRQTECGDCAQRRPFPHRVSG